VTGPGHTHEHGHGHDHQQRTVDLQVDLLAGNDELPPATGARWPSGAWWPST